LSPELRRSARVGRTSAHSLNEHVQQLLHPWTSYLILPLFARANAGISINGRRLANGRRHYSAEDIGSLSEAVSATRARVTLAA
jgi:Na+/H+ antiporter 1